MPATIGPYEIVERLQAGGAESELFTARRAGDAVGSLVCIKRIHPNFGGSVEFAERYDRELDLARKLRHRNIVEVSGHGEDGGHYFAMEYIDGPSLGALLEWGALSPGLVTYIGIELCRALAFLHHSDASQERGPVIHSDISPENVLLSRRDGAVKLSDFGLAKALGRTGQETITRQRGKPTWMAPEQHLEQKISTRTDLFGLGLVLWRALVGEHPYAAGRPRGRIVVDWVREQTTQNARRSTGEAAPHAPKALCDAIEGLLQPIERRTPTAEDVFNVLRHVEPLDGHAQLADWIGRVGESA